MVKVAWVGHLVGNWTLEGQTYRWDKSVRKKTLIKMAKANRVKPLLGIEHWKDILINGIPLGAATTEANLIGAVGRRQGWQIEKIKKNVMLVVNWGWELGRKARARKGRGN